MSGLVPAIHVFLACDAKDVDARHKAGMTELHCKTSDFIGCFLSQNEGP